MYAVISGVEDRIKASDRYGSQLYLSWKFINDLYQSDLGYEGMVGAVIFRRYF